MTFETKIYFFKDSKVFGFADALCSLHYFASLTVCVVAQERTRVQTPADVIGVEHMMKLEGGSANQIVRFESHQLCHPGNGKMAGKQGEEKYSEIHHLKYSTSPKSLFSSSSTSQRSKFWSYLPSQCVKCRSMVWRVRKAQVSRGNSTLDGWGMGSHSSVITLAAGGDLALPANGRIRPVQRRTCSQSDQTGFRWRRGVQD